MFEIKKNIYLFVCLPVLDYEKIINFFLLKKKLFTWLLIFSLHNYGLIYILIEIYIKKYNFKIIL